MGGYYRIFYENIGSTVRTTGALNRHGGKIQWEEKQSWSGFVREYQYTKPERFSVSSNRLSKLPNKLIMCINFVTIKWSDD